MRETGPDVPWEPLPKHFTVRGGASFLDREADADKGDVSSAQSTEFGPSKFLFPELPEFTLRLLLTRRADLERAIQDLESRIDDDADDYATGQGDLACQARTESKDALKSRDSARRRAGTRRQKS